MANIQVMLALSPTMETGTIAKWNKSEGDTVSSGDILCEVETDKTTMEYETTDEGTVLKIIAGRGTQVAVGDPIAIVGEKGEDISELLAQTAASKPKAEAKAKVEGEGKEKKNDSESPRPSTLDTRPSSAPSGVLASPLARRIAQDNKLDISTIQGSGPSGRVVKRDVEAALSGGAPRKPAPVAPDGDEIVPVSEKRKVIAQRLTGSFQFAPHYYIKIAVNAGLLLQERARVNKSAPQKVSLNAFIIKFVAESIRRHPIVNASWKGDTIIKHKSIDIALAVAQPDGLITPIVRDCANKGIVDIDKELKVLIEKARTNKLAPEEYTGGTFTISNLGMFGIREFTAIINPPEAAILAVGEIAKQTVVDEKGDIVIQPTLLLTLSCDHRVLYGAVSAAFMKTLKEMIEDPINLIL